MAKRRSAAVMDIRPLSLTCTFGQPDVQGQAHALAEITRPHAGLEQGRFAAPEALPSLMRTVYRAAARHAAAKADGVTVSVPSSYTQVYMRFAELPLAGPVTAQDMDELLDMAEEAPLPPGYRLLRAEPLAWQIDGVLLRHAPEGAVGRLLQGYFALTYGDDLLCRELAEAALAADLPTPCFEAVPCALARYAAHRLNLLDTFLLLDSDELTTSVLVAQRGKLWHKQEVPLGTECMVWDEMERSGLSGEEARKRVLSETVGPRGRLSETSTAIMARVNEILARLDAQLKPASVSLSDRSALVISGGGWTGLPGMEDLLTARTGAARVMRIPAEPNGASVNGMALLDMALAQEPVDRLR